MKRIPIEPRAASLIESLRDLGYSLDTALADIIDNSIAAGALNVEVFLEADEINPAIAVMDDGHGMMSDELVEAMRPGCVGPHEPRKGHDLGRFGLGLKTASFSQCRRVTVISRSNGQLHGARWDLDDVVQENAWLLHVLDNGEIKQTPWADCLLGDGTLVLWEKLDRLADRTSGVNLKDHLYDSLDVARKHVSLVFHRFLAGEPSLPKIALRINGSPVEPFDPFNSKNLATQHLPVDVLQVEGCKVVIQPYILPHHKKVSSLDYKHYAGEGGYLKNQGFYVYRNGRLIIHRTWFRIAKKTQLTKLARVQVDMPTELDHLWKIDVRKASAQPPFAVRNRFKSVIDKITSSSGNVYTHRGRKLVGDGVQSLWIRTAKHNEISYRINREHPVLSHFLEWIDGEKRKAFDDVLKTVEQCFPAASFFADSAENPDGICSPDISPELLRTLLGFTLKTFRAQGVGQEEIIDKLETTDPFRSNMEAVMILLEEMEEHSGD